MGSNGTASGALTKGLCMPASKYLLVSLRQTLVNFAKEYYVLRNWDWTEVGVTPVRP